MCCSLTVIYRYCVFFIILSPVSKCCRPSWLAVMPGSNWFLSGYNCSGFPSRCCDTRDWRLYVRYSMGNVCRPEESVCRPAFLLAFRYLRRILACACCKLAVLEAVRIDNA